MVIGFREWDAQKLMENLHNKQVNCTALCAIPLALATLSTTAAAINSDFDPSCVIFGPPDRHIPLSCQSKSRVPPYSTPRIPHASYIASL
jgi:hypothetical protein